MAAHDELFSKAEADAWSGLLERSRRLTQISWCSLNATLGRAAFLASALRQLGYAYQASCSQGSTHDRRFVLLASKSSFEAEYFEDRIVHATHGDFSHRCVLGRFANLNVMGVYLPPDRRKSVIFDFLFSVSPLLLGERALLIGDLNTGTSPQDAQGVAFTCEEQFSDLLAAGWIDAWRSRNPQGEEFTWLWRRVGNGFRIDHAFASPQLNPVIGNVRYSHTERINGVSDHSVLIVDIPSSATGV